MKVKITSDSTCDLSLQLIEKYDIDILPIRVTMGDVSGKDGVDFSPESIYPMVEKTGELPKTSALNVSEYHDFFAEWSSLGYSIVHFCIGSKFSSTYQNACIAAEEFENVYVVDSQNLSTGQGLLVLAAAEMAQKGQSADLIYRSSVENTEKAEASFVIDTLDYLYKGGRCSALAAFGSNLLQLKPCIEVRDGSMLPTKKYRGKIDNVMLQYVKDRLADRGDIDKHRIFVTHTRCLKESVDQVVALVRELAPDAEEILETTAGATVTSHCGPNTLGVLFMRL